MNKRDTWKPDGCHSFDSGHGPGEHPDGGGGNNPPFARCQLGASTVEAVTLKQGKHTRRRVSGLPARAACGKTRTCSS